MRSCLFLAAALCAGAALADEPQACYVAKDPTGDFVAARMLSSDADPAIGAQVRHLMNESSRATAKCVKRYIDREGGWPRGAGLLYGARISPEGKLTQVSVLAVNNVNDAMLMACLGRSICEWELKATGDGQERLVTLPPYLLGRGWQYQGPGDR